jgi:hypothetical protein
MSKEHFEFPIPCKNFKIGKIRLTDTIFEPNHKLEEDFVNSTFENACPPPLFINS